MGNTGLDSKKTVVLWSGGIDSTTAIAMLLERGVEVWPVFVKRGQRNITFEEESVGFFSRFFAKKHGEKFHRPVAIKANIPPLEFKEKFGGGLRTGHPLRNSTLVNIGVQCAVSLGKGVKTVLICNNTDDSLPHSSPESLLTQNLLVCVHMDDWDWRVGSPFYENRHGWTKMDKQEVVNWATEHGLPLERMRSCVSQSNTPCGKCIACRHLEGVL